MQYLNYFLVIVGIGFLTAGLYYTGKIVQELQGTSKRYWQVVFWLILFFIVGYLAYCFFLLIHHDNDMDLRSHLDKIVALIFCFGGLFVFVIMRISSRTIEQVKEISRLTYEAERDPLTNLYNRRYFEKSIDRVFHQIHRNPTVVASLLFIDVNQFKCINDNAGHLVGDNVLKEIAEILHSRIRKVDVAARYGGDEFVVLLYNTDLEGAKNIAAIFSEKIAEKLQQLFSDVFDKCSEVGCSIGIALLDQTKNDVNQVIKEADQACYAAKNSSIGSIIVFGETV